MEAKARVRRRDGPVRKDPSCISWDNVKRGRRGLSRLTGQDFNVIHDLRHNGILGKRRGEIKTSQVRPAHHVRKKMKTKASSEGSVRRRTRREREMVSILFDGGSIPLGEKTERPAWRCVGGFRLKSRIALCRKKGEAEKGGARLKHRPRDI